MDVDGCVRCFYFGLFLVHFGLDTFCICLRSQDRSGMWRDVEQGLLNKFPRTPVLFGRSDEIARYYLFGLHTLGKLIR